MYIGSNASFNITHISESFKPLMNDSMHWANHNHNHRWNRCNDIQSHNFSHLHRVLFHSYSYFQEAEAVNRGSGGHRETEFALHSRVRPSLFNNLVTIVVIIGVFVSIYFSEFIAKTYLTRSSPIPPLCSITWQPLFSLKMDLSLITEQGLVASLFLITWWQLRPNAELSIWPNFQNDYFTTKNWWRANQVEERDRDQEQQRLRDQALRPPAWLHHQHPLLRPIFPSS